MNGMEAGRSWDAADLVGGEDHDFVLTLYLATLGRMPDPAGYRHYREFVEGRPERRMEALRAVAASEEARRAGDRIRFGSGPAVPPAPARVTAVSSAVRLDYLLSKVAQLEEAIGLMGGAGFAADLIESRDAALHFEVEALRREVKVLTEAQPGAAGGHATPLPALAHLVVEQVAQRVTALAAEQEHRLRTIEARLLAIEARQGE